MNQTDIHKVAGILIKDRKLLITRAKGKTFFVSPGGKVDQGETIEQTLKRELKEELDIDVGDNDCEYFGKFSAPAQGQEHKNLEMDIFLVSKWDGEVTPSNEVEEIMWVDSELSKDIELGSIFRHEVLPKLKSLSLIN